MTSDLLFTSLRRAGSSSSQETVPTSWHPTYYLHHFCKAGRPVRERQCQLRDTRRIIYITSGRRVTQFARDSTHFVTPDLLLTSLRGGGQKAKQRNGTHPNDATHQQTDTPTDRQTNETNRKRRRRQEHNTEGKEGKEREETTTRDERKKAQKRSAKPPNRAEADRIGRVSNLFEPVRCAP